MEKIPTNWCRYTVLPMVIYKGGEPYAICHKYDPHNHITPKDLEFPLYNLLSAVIKTEKNRMRAIRRCGGLVAIPSTAPLRRELSAVQSARRTIEALIAGIGSQNSELTGQ